MIKNYLTVAIRNLMRHKLYTSINEVDDSFFETFDIPVLRGRTFSADVASDTSQAIILNETAVRLQSTGRLHISSGHATLARIYIAHPARQSHRLANRLLSDARLALWICLSDRFKCPAICRKRDNGTDHRLWDRKPAGHSRSAIQPD